MDERVAQYSTRLFLNHLTHRALSLLILLPSLISALSRGRLLARSPAPLLRRIWRHCRMMSSPFSAVSLVESLHGGNESILVESTEYTAEVIPQNVQGRKSAALVIYNTMSD